MRDPIITRLDGRLSWKRDKKTATLFANDEQVIQLHLEKKLAYGAIGDDLFEFVTKGAWNPRVILKKNKVEIAVLVHQFWGSKGSVALQNGAKFYAIMKNLPMVSLQVTDLEEKELVAYSLTVRNKKGAIELYVAPDAPPSEDLLYLILLGYYMMRNIQLEYADGTIEAVLAAVSATT